MNLHHVFMLTLLLRVYTCEVSESRRLVLHSGDDIATEFQMLRQEIQDLKAEVTTLKQAQLKHNDRRLVLHSSEDLALEVQLLRQELNALKQEQGSTYVRWGKTTCDGNRTEKVYSGFTAGSPYEINGGAARYVCLPQHPTWAKYVDGIQNIGGYISGTEYQIFVNLFSPFPHNMHDQDAPCVLCRSPRPTTVMIPGRTDCYSGWTTEYTGYLMTDYKDDVSASDYACVDVNPEALYHGEANLNGKLLYFTEVKCGSLPCQEYPDGRELACVVCSK